jgi:hypothetical protein
MSEVGELRERVASLEAQLDQVRAANNTARDEERNATEWAVDAEARRSLILSRLGNRLDAILDTAPTDALEGGHNE